MSPRSGAGSARCARARTGCGSSWPYTMSTITSVCPMPAYACPCRSPSAPTAAAPRSSGGPVRQRWRRDSPTMSGRCEQSHQNTPFKRIASPTDTIEVTDPTHPLYGLIFPLLEITTKPRLGRVCVVGLYPGVERVIPLAATSLGGPPTAPSACRLSVEGLQALDAVVATWDSRPQEEPHVDLPCFSASPQPPVGLSMVRGAPVPAPRASRSLPYCASTTLGNS